MSEITKRPNFLVIKVYRGLLLIPQKKARVKKTGIGLAELFWSKRQKILLKEIWANLQPIFLRNNESWCGPSVGLLVFYKPILSKIFRVVCPFLIIEWKFFVENTFRNFAFLFLTINNYLMEESFYQNA